MIKPPIPPFTEQSAHEKARLAEDAWNSRDPLRVSLAYSEESRWRNRSEFFTGRDAILLFLEKKWKAELEYRLIKEVWSYGERRISVRFVYESHNPDGQWKRSFGNELWEFDDKGLMARREASINDLEISPSERRFFWPLGRRPDSHPSLRELGF